MQEMKFKWPKGVPDSEHSLPFIQGMLDRMALSFFKYGAIKKAYPHKINALKCLKARLKKYRDTGNTEWLIDVANWAMIEFLRPRHPGAHFRATEAQESPGRPWDGELDPSSRGNEDD